MSQLQKNQPKFRKVIFQTCSILSLLFIIVSLGTSCNDYPIQAITAKSYTEVTETLTQSGSKKVDILFVVDNSQSMEEEQAKLAENFKYFIEELTRSGSSGVQDYQIGIVTTDMDFATQSGKLQGKPRIIRSTAMTRKQLINSFVANVIVGTNGTSYEKGLAAMKSALSKPLLNGYNKGFLRKDAILAVIIVADEDDCSNNNTLKAKETEYPPIVCRLPKTELLRDRSGTIIRDSNNKEIRGQLHNLIKVADYIKFLKKLKPPGQVVVAGLLGNPEVRDKNKALVPKGGGGSCKVIPNNPNVECTVGNSLHKCISATATQKRCGGCQSIIGGKKSDAWPGYRYHEVIKGLNKSTNWFSICGKKEEFKNALLNFAGLIVTIGSEVSLGKEPVDGTLSVSIVDASGKATPLDKAKKLKPVKKCGTDSDCGSYVCGKDSFCYGDGWVYIPPVSGKTKALIKLSGTAKEKAKQDTKIEVTFVSK